MEEFLKIGTITSTHGIKGEVKVYPSTDDLNRFKKLKKVYLRFKNEEVILEASGARISKNMVILKFKDINDINDVEKYKGAELFVDRKSAVKLEKDEYFIADIIGSKVKSDDNLYEGELTDVFKTGANDVYEITLQDGKVILIPAIKECILDVNPNDRTIMIHILDGLLD